MWSTVGILVILEGIGKRCASLLGLNARERVNFNMFVSRPLVTACAPPHMVNEREVQSSPRRAKRQRYARMGYRFAWLDLKKDKTMTSLSEY